MKKIFKAATAGPGIVNQCISEWNFHIIKISIKYSLCEAPAWDKTAIGGNRRQLSSALENVTVN